MLESWPKERILTVPGNSIQTNHKHQDYSAITPPSILKLQTIDYTQNCNAYNIGIQAEYGQLKKRLKFMSQLKLAYEKKRTLPEHLRHLKHYSSATKMNPIMWTDMQMRVLYGNSPSVYDLANTSTCKMGTQLNNPRFEKVLFKNRTLTLPYKTTQKSLKLVMLWCLVQELTNPLGEANYMWLQQPFSILLLYLVVIVYICEILCDHYQLF